jgi:hypothetical protein
LAIHREHAGDRAARLTLVAKEMGFQNVEDQRVSKSPNEIGIEQGNRAR